MIAELHTTSELGVQSHHSYFIISHVWWEENSGGVQLTCPASETLQGWLAACGWGWRNSVARADSFSRIKSRCSCEPGGRSDFRDLVSMTLCHGCSVLMVKTHTQALPVLGIGIEPPVLGRRCATEFMVPY